MKEWNMRDELTTHSMPQRKFWAGLAAMLAIPAVIYVAAGLTMGRTSLAHFWFNYLYMAAPQLLVGLAAVRPQYRRAGLLAILAILNAVLACFQTWLIYPERQPDSALAWLIYWPLSFAVLVVALLGWAMLSAHRRRASRFGS